MDRIRRVGGEMESHRRPAGSRLLLPYEIQLCEAVGITADEYWEFFDRVTQAEKKRGEAYALIPDIRNEPVSTTTILVSLAIGVATTAIGYLLAPKPKAPNQQKKQQGERLNVEGIDGRSRFSPTYKFDSIQDLATLGSLPPLIFAKRENGHGGVRVKSQLLWSRLRSLGTHQELQAILMFGAGSIRQGDQPDFKGYMIGDQSLINYGEGRSNLTFMFGSRSQTRIDTPGSNQHDYVEATLPKSWQVRFKPYWDQDRTESDKVHSGTRTPTTSAQFGIYSPCPNGNGLAYPFDVIAVPPKDNNNDDAQRVREEAQAKRKKNHESMTPSGASFIDAGTGGGKQKFRYLIRGTSFNRDSQSFWRKRRPESFEYRGRTSYNHSDPISVGDSLFKDAGKNADGTQKSLQVREEVDTYIEVGEQYMIGQNVYKCTELESGRDQPPFDASQGDQANKQYLFEEVPELRRGDIDVVLADAPGPNSNFHGCETYNLMRCSIATIRTTRKVRQVEIGLRSVVWHQINGLPNIMNYPGYQDHNKLTKAGGGVTLGNINAYRHRYSFFTLEYRKISWENWRTLVGKDEPFAVKGSSPEAIHNFIRISFDTDQDDEYEFRLMPLPGNYVRQQFGAVPMYGTSDAKPWAQRKTGNALVFNPNAQLARIDRNGVTVRFPGEVKSICPNDFFHREYILRTTADDKGFSLFANSISPNPGTDFEDWYDDLSRNNLCFFSAISDYFSRAESNSSHLNDPEHTITYVNEMAESDMSPQYQRLNYVGLELRSAKEWSNFSNFSAYFRKGIQVEKLVSSSDEFGPTNLFPEIATFLLTNKAYGAGQIINDAQVNKTRMTRAARFCEANGFYWDGIVDEKQNLREFIFTNAGYCLLDFTIIGGKFSLVPSVPHNADYTINNAATPEIDALFTDSNTKDLKVTFLSPEEREPFVAELMWRDEEQNGTAETRTIQVWYDETGTDQNFANRTDTPDIRDQVEVFDMSGFATTPEQCLKFAFAALKTRVHVDHSVQFDTTPEAAMGLAPGGYFRLVTEAAHIYPDGRGRRLMNGSIDSTGTVQGNGLEDGTYNIYYWKPSDTPDQVPGASDVREGSMTIEGGRCLDTGLHNSLYSVRSETRHDRVYKVETLSYSLQDGLINITGSHTPLDGAGRLEILQDWPVLNRRIQGNRYFFIEEN